MSTIPELVASVQANVAEIHAYCARLEAIANEMADIRAEIERAKAKRQARFARKTKEAK